MGVDRGAEGGHDVLAGDRGVGGQAQGVAGVVIEPGQDLGVGAVGQGPVGEVGLPALVGQVGLEAQVAAFRAFAGFGGDQPFAGQDPPDRRTDGTCSPLPCRWACRVCGPASSPAAVSS